MVAMVVVSICVARYDNWEDLIEMYLIRSYLQGRSCVLGNFQEQPLA